jgi:hypothetical protein
LAKFFTDTLEESKKKWDGQITEYQTCAKEIFESLA